VVFCCTVSRFLEYFFPKLDYSNQRIGLLYRKTFDSRQC